ncbi:MAG: [ribosomal protein S5]-alanine N-acetyltransferase [Clostridiales bacterium]|nr:[ribosomal protein S5]-alanine N-acetyltransferase [Clostridiales bacterium]
MIALDEPHLALYLKEETLLYLEMGLNQPRRQTDKALKYAFSQAHKAVLNAPEQYFWHTRWEVILKALDMSIGEFCFKGVPDKNGIVEIGYGIDSPFQGMGYGTEAVSRMMDWLMASKEAAIVKAETEWDNLSSQALLKRAGFVKYRIDGDSIWWRRRMPSFPHMPAAGMPTRAAKR